MSIKYHDAAVTLFQGLKSCSPIPTAASTGTHSEDPQCPDRLARGCSSRINGHAKDSCACRVSANSFWLDVPAHSSHCQPHCQPVSAAGATSAGGVHGSSSKFTQICCCIKITWDLTVPGAQTKSHQHQHCKQTSSAAHMTLQTAGPWSGGTWSQTAIHHAVWACRGR